MSELKTRADDRGQAKLGGQEASAGYSVNGESEFSRRVACGSSGDVKMTTHEKQSMSKLELLIVRHIGELERLEAKLANETNPAAAGRLAKQQEIKMRFIAKLRAEQLELTNERT
jgi:hypothetical protein